jgi:ubiquinone/menaquinone biosynthesis C-methylase UbiE
MSYLNFGYIPEKSFINNLIRFFTGFPNLYKRLQANDIMKALGVKPDQTILDFGCGRGYITYEIAKKAKKTIGIDISPILTSQYIPADMMDKLEFIVCQGENLPFNDNSFDTVLASEILPMIDNHDLFMNEISRVLKTNGKLVIVNGAGHPAIEEAYLDNNKTLSKLKSKYPSRFPSDYNNYCKILQESFGTAKKSFLTDKMIEYTCLNNHFVNAKLYYSPGYIAGSYISWYQFKSYLKTGNTLPNYGFLILFYILSVISLFDKNKYRGGVICVASNKK